MTEQNVKIEEFFNILLNEGYEIEYYKDYERINLKDKNIQILTQGNKYVGLNYLSRHKTKKHLVQLTVQNNKDIYSVTITTDHVCMVYNRDHFFEQTSANELSIGQYMQVLDEKTNKEYIGTVIKLEDLGETDEYVYDCEVDDDLHLFYANNIVIHNSQFIDLAPVTNWMRCRYDLPEKIKDWPTDKRQELWNTMSEMTEKQINKFVRDLVHEYSKTSQQDVLTYELEYLSDVGVYESKKHYFTHKIFEEGDKVDKIKVTGIELKKNQVPKSVKKFLQDIYEGVVINYWTESDYQNYVSQLFDKFKKLSIEDIAFWKGYSTERKAAGFLQMQVGTTGIAKACIYYNQIIEKLGLGNKYDTIMVGDKVRFVYLTHNNKYGINCIAYKPGFWPKEFDSIFEVDYKTMFEKIILDPLKRFREACKFQNFNPDKQVQFDIFDL